MSLKTAERKAAEFELSISHLIGKTIVTVGMPD